MSGCVDKGDEPISAVYRVKLSSLAVKTASLASHPGHGGLNTDLTVEKLLADAAWSLGGCEPLGEVDTERQM